VCVGGGWYGVGHRKYVTLFLYWLAIRIFSITKGVFVYVWCLHACEYVCVILYVFLWAGVDYARMLYRVFDCLQLCSLRVYVFR
jgi:hypothetical protein